MSLMVSKLATYVVVWPDVWRCERQSRAEGKFEESVAVGDGEGQDRGTSGGRGGEMREGRLVKM